MKKVIIEENSENSLENQENESEFENENEIEEETPLNFSNNYIEIINNLLKENQINEEFNENKISSFDYGVNEQKEINNNLKEKDIEKDLDDLNKIIDQNGNNLYLLHNNLKNISEFLEKNPIKSEGISFLDVKTHLFLSYEKFLMIYLLFKHQGKSIKNHPIINRLIYIKSLLIKLKPMEKKMDYQINKLLRLSQKNELANNQNLTNQIDPLSYKPRPDLLLKEKTKNELEINEDGDLTQKPSNSNLKYKPPKLAAILSKDDKIEEKKKKQNERHKKHLLRSNFIQNLEEEDSSKPQEYKLKDIYEQVYDKEERDRIRYEEENFTRIPYKKKEKIRLKKKMKKIVNDRIDDFKEMENIREILVSDGLIEKKNFKDKKISTDFKKQNGSFKKQGMIKKGINKKGKFNKK